MKRQLSSSFTPQFNTANPTSPPNIKKEARHRLEHSSRAASKRFDTDIKQGAVPHIHLNGKHPRP